MKRGNDIKSTSTQTSKTILELARYEEDKVMAKSEEKPKSEKISEQAAIPEKRSIKAETSNDRLNIPQIDSSNLLYSRKSNIHAYLNNCKIEDSAEDVKNGQLKDKTLIETFLNSKANAHSIPSDVFSHSGHTQFLQQTSPFKNLEAICQPKYDCKSQSYSNFLSYEGKTIPNHPLSRFTVKRVYQQIDVVDVKEKNKSGIEGHQLKSESDCYKSNRSGSFQAKFRASPKSYGSSKRSKSFMSPTIASEQRNQLPEVSNVQRLISPTKRGRSVSPRSNGFVRSHVRKIPYIDESTSGHQETIALDAKTELKHGVDKSPTGCKENVSKVHLGNSNSDETIFDCSQFNDSTSNASSDNMVVASLNRLRSNDW